MPTPPVRATTRPRVTDADRASTTQATAVPDHPPPLSTASLRVALTPFDDDLWALRLARSEVAALRTDWDRVATGAPGHDIRRLLALARDVIHAAERDIQRGRHPLAVWRSRFANRTRAARRLVVRQELAYFGRWISTGRRYFG